MSFKSEMRGFTKNGINVPFTPTKKTDRNKTTRYEIVQLSKIGICFLNYLVETVCLGPNSYE